MFMCSHTQPLTQAAPMTTNKQHISTKQIMSKQINQDAPYAPLTKGGIQQLILSEGHFSGIHIIQPTLQLINIRRVPANALTDVYWAVLSDGENSVEVVISTHLSHLVQSGQLVEHTIIKVNTYQYNITDDNIHIVSVGEIDIYEESPNEVIGEPMSVLDSMHKKDVIRDHYFDLDDDEWEDDSDKEEPLTWSLDEPSNFCDWTIEVSRIGPPPSSPSQSSLSSSKHGKKGKGGSKAEIQYYHVHKAILSVG